MVPPVTDSLSVIGWGRWIHRFGPRGRGEPVRHPDLLLRRTCTLEDEEPDKPEPDRGECSLPRHLVRGEREQQDADGHPGFRGDARPRRAVPRDAPHHGLQDASAIERQSGKDVEDRYEQVDVADVPEHSREGPDPAIDARRGPEETAERETRQGAEDRDRERGAGTP